MKNYYQILEVDQRASKEVIEKAYRTLVKKYHPDLYATAQKKEAEMRATEIERQAQAQAAVHDRYREYAQELMAMGFTPEQVAQLLQVEAAKSLGSNAIVNVGGSSPQPMFTVPLNFGQQSGPQEQQAQQSSPTGEEVDPDQNTQGGRRR